MLYEVRRSTCDISLAIAGRTLRITSRVTTSIEWAGVVVMSARFEMDDEFAGVRHLEPIVREDGRRAAVLLDDRGACYLCPAAEGGPLIDGPLGRLVEPDLARGGRLS